MKVSALQKNRKSGFTLIELMVVIAILVSLAAIGSGPVLDHLNDGERQKASSNLKSVFTILQQFKSDHNNFPCDTTAEEIMERYPELNFGPVTGSTSNDYLRQVFYDSQKNKSEKPFFAKLNVAGKTVHEGDEKRAKGQALQRGENGMAYIVRKNPDDPNMKLGVIETTSPLAICGVYPSATPYAGNELAFDMSSFRGHAFLLSVDGSVKDLEMNLAKDESNSEKGFYVDKQGKRSSIFPEDDNGNDPSANFIILTPDM
ncbi:MAG: prepilin-type N-terminal cleavage/methylation domain-containing protein [Akkermansia sp.]|nr:prepilin-type N-terminal cleavage/methylation domain-containing protein [Akkermansia sp.]